MKKLYGLIGYPVKHSLSAAMHNAAFKHLRIGAEYKLFEVKPEELSDFFASFKKKRLCGINITIPHKERSLKFMDRLAPPAQEIGAVNTVVLEGDKLVGYNTDEHGFMASLREDLRFNPSSGSAVILGAGGAARAVSFALVSSGIKRVVVADIDAKRAASLAGDIDAWSGRPQKRRCEAIAVENDKKTIGEFVLNSDLLVNATPCGMKKNDPGLVPGEFLHRKLSVFDLIYNPPETPLIKDAQKRGLRAVNGLGMLLRQGAFSFYLWTKQEAPIEVMRQALIKTKN